VESVFPDSTLSVTKRLLLYEKGLWGKRKPNAAFHPSDHTPQNKKKRPPNERNRRVKTKRENTKL
jgi:hypothetical protein